LEHGHGNEVVADFSTVAYWYQTEPHRPLTLLPPPDDRRVLGVKIPPGAALADSLVVLEAPEGGWRIQLPVPRPDLYDVWAYPGGADGRPDRPIRLYQELSISDWEMVVVNSQGGALPVALHAVPVPHWASEWMVAGPFPNPQQVGSEYSAALDSVFAPEEDPDPALTYRLPSGETGQWLRVSGDSTGYVRLNPHFEPSDWVAAYAQAFLFSPTARGGVLLLGADDAHQLWVNGELVSTRQGRNISLADQMVVPVALVAGWNRVLLKVADLDGGWAFHLRAADPSRELRWAVAEPGVG